MQETKQLKKLRKTLQDTLTIREFPSQSVERLTFPEVEMNQNKELILKPVHVQLDNNEDVLIEASVNSVRISIKYRNRNEIEDMFMNKFAGYLMRRSADFLVYRKTPVKGYHFSMLITSKHTRELNVGKLIDFVLESIYVLNKYIQEIKSMITLRCEFMAKDFIDVYKTG